MNTLYKIQALASEYDLSQKQVWSVLEAAIQDAGCFMALAKYFDSGQDQMEQDEVDRGTDPKWAHFRWRTRQFVFNSVLNAAASLYKTRGLPAYTPLGGDVDASEKDLKKARAELRDFLITRQRHEEHDPKLFESDIEDVLCLLWPEDNFEDWEEGPKINFSQSLVPISYIPKETLQFWIDELSMDGCLAFDAADLKSPRN